VKKAKVGNKCVLSEGRKVETADEYWIGEVEVCPDGWGVI